MERKFIMPDGAVKDEKELTPAEKSAIAQRILDEFTPLIYESLVQDLQREREGGELMRSSFREQ